MRHSYISTFEAQPGMLLAGRLRQVSNHRLFQLMAGTRLTEDLIHQMSVRNIQCLVIEEAESRSQGELDAAGERILQETDQAFVGANLARPAVAALHAAVLAYRLQCS